MLELRGARDNDANPTPDAPTLTEQSTDTAPKVALYGEVPTVAGVGSGAGYAAMASRPAGFQQFHLHQQHQMALANQVNALPHKSTILDADAEGCVRTFVRVSSRYTYIRV
jgi:hypothetical protein